MDIAPEASLHIANPSSGGELLDATQWMIQEGVSVINHSVSWYFDGPGDGTSPYGNSPLQAVDLAVDAGVLWVNAAGNHARTSWFGPPQDRDGDQWLNFGNPLEFSNPQEFSSEGIEVNLEPNEGIHVQLRWEDSWQGAETDLDLLVYEGSTLEPIAASADPQRGQPGEAPLESLEHRSPTRRQAIITVYHHTGPLPEWVQLVTWNTGKIQDPTPGGSIGNPAESANPGMLTVGAAPWYDPLTIEPYSSRGPTPDGRVKPEITGATCGETTLLPLNKYRKGFCGTSQAAPHAGGMAALVRQAFPDLSPAETAGYLKENAVQRRHPDPNNTWGHGFALLPAPTPPAAPAINTVTAGPDQLTVGWNVPWDNGPAQPDRHDLRHQAPGNGWTTLNHVGAPGTGPYRHTITGLLGNTTHDIQVRSGNRWGPSPWSAVRTGTTTPPVPPTAPRDLTARMPADRTRVDLAWMTPENPGGAPVSQYRVEHSPDSQGPWTQLTRTNGDVLSHMDTPAGSQPTFQPTFQPGASRHYRVRAANSAGAGPPSNTATAVPDPCLEQLGDLSNPVTRNGTWADDCMSEGQANNYARYYTFTLDSETRVAIHLTSGWDTYLYLRLGGRTGTVVHENNNVGRGSINSRIEEPLAAGVYTVEATTHYRSAVNGAFTLDVRPVVRVQELGTLTETYTTPGAWSEDFVSARQPNNYARYYRFTLDTPTDVRIDLTSGRDTYLYLVREDGTVVAENNNVGRSINSRIVQTPLADGTYTVEATTYYRNPVTGNFVLNIGLNAGPVPQNACLEELGDISLAPPGIQSGAWAGECNSRARPGSHARYYGFELEEPGRVEVNLTSGLDTYLVLRDGKGPDGAVIEENDNVGSRNFNSSINRELEAGEYTLEATTYFPGQDGSFTLSARTARHTEQLGELNRGVDRSNSAWVEAHRSGQRPGSHARFYNFNLVETTHVAINLTSPQDPYLYVRRDGRILHENDNVTRRNLNSRIDETLPAGRYSIEATTYFPNQTGLFHLSIGHLGAAEAGAG